MSRIGLCNLFELLGDSHEITSFCKNFLRLSVGLDRPIFFLMIGNDYNIILYLSVSVIGQFCGPYFNVRPAKFESFLFRAPD